MESYPAPPPQGPPPAVQPPKSVLTAVNLIWVSVAVGLIHSVLSFILIDDLVDEQSNTAGLTRDEIRAGVILGIVIGAIIAVVIAAIFAFLIKKGANWARIVYTVLGVLSALFALLSLATQPPLFLVLTLVSLVLTVAIIYFLWQKDSNAYFTRPKNQY